MNKVIEYLIVVQTNRIAHWLHRELTAYATGKTGMSSSADLEAKDFRGEGLNFDTKIGTFMNDFAGISRSFVQLNNVIGVTSLDVCIVCKEKPSLKDIKTVLNRSIKFARKPGISWEPFKVTGIKLIKKETIYNEVTLN